MLCHAKGNASVTGQSGEPWAGAHGCESRVLPATCQSRTPVLPYPARQRLLLVLAVFEESWGLLPPHLRPAPPVGGSL